MLMNREQIMEIIPHRPPFLLIDEITEMELGKSITAIKYVEKEEYYFEGHFPDEKVMPGVLIVEALAQAGAVAILSMEEHKGKTPYFGGIKDARFKQKVVPGDVLKLCVELTAIRGSIGKGIGIAYLGDKVACKCEITFAIG